jgi:DnaJ-class molecular chaperone
LGGLAPTEITALARIIGEIDYYQLLDLRRNAVAGEVKKAYHATRRAFHPDAHRHLDADLQEAVRVIAMRVSEAYSVLRDPRRRQAYDARLDAGDGLRMQLAEAQAEAGRKADAELGGKTPQGRQYHRLAQKDIARSDYAAAARNLQTALTFEPGNELFKRMLAEAREKL